MKTMSDDICMIKEQFPENMFSEAASKLKSALKSTQKKCNNIDFFSNENSNKCLLFTEVMKIVQPLVHTWQHFFLFWSTV